MILIHDAILLRVNLAAFLLAGSILLRVLENKGMIPMWIEANFLGHASSQKLLAGTLECLRGQD